MTRSMKFLAIAFLCAIAFSVTGASQAKAGIRFGISYGNGYNRGFYGGYRHSGPVYHAPSIRYQRTYHHDYYHWTPRRGLHSHGHYHVTPRYVPGHYDYKHGNHYHLNPRYHRHGH